jgi:phosphoribosylformylglycinamidine synthase I
VRAAPPAAVVVFPGSNGDRDLLETFERAGFAPRLHASSEPLAPDVRIAGLPGGFSYGDYWRAGMLASQARAVRSLPDLVDRGGLVIGICNGFQILVEYDLLPGALAGNAPPGFRHRWLEVETTAAAAGPWFSSVDDGTVLRMPMAHGEGRFLHPGGPEAVAGRVPLCYRENPNGSMADAAALLDETGRILGVMPHPERASEPDIGSDDGMVLFRSARAWLEEAG